MHFPLSSADPLDAKYLEAGTSKVSGTGVFARMEIAAGVVVSAYGGLRVPMHSEARKTGYR